MKKEEFVEKFENLKRDDKGNFTNRVCNLIIESDYKISIYDNLSFLQGFLAVLHNDNAEINLHYYNNKVDCFNDF